jgi:hypothetical protein
MSEIMLHGILNMPLPSDPKDCDIVTWVQFKSAAQDASTRIKELEAENGRLKELLSGFYPSEDIEDLLSGWMIWWKSKGGSDE